MVYRATDDQHVSAEEMVMVHICKMYNKVERRIT